MIKRRLSPEYVQRLPWIVLISTLSVSDASATCASLGFASPSPSLIDSLDSSHFFESSKYASDGAYNSRWSSTRSWIIGNGDSAKWVKWNLGAPKVVETFKSRERWCCNQYLKTFNLEHSMDGTSWTQLPTVSTVTGVSTTSLTPTVIAKWLRLTALTFNSRIAGNFDIMGCDAPCSALVTQPSCAGSCYWSPAASPKCQACPSVPNAVCTACSDASSCTTFQCNAGYGNVDGINANGCEFFYAKGAMGTNVCPSGFERITSGFYCAIAATAWGAAYQYALNNIAYQKGCWEMTEGSGSFYFNAHPTGAAFSKASPVCQTIITTTTTTIRTTSTTLKAWFPDTATPTTMLTTTISTSTTLTTTLTSVIAEPICSFADPTPSPNAASIGGLRQVDGYSCESSNDFASLDFAIQVCKETPSCKAVHNTQCNMQHVGGVFSLCRGGAWLSTSGDCIYMKD